MKIARVVLLAFGIASITARSAAAEAAALRIAPPLRKLVLRGPDQPSQFRYVAFPSILPVAEDTIWIACKAGSRHATDAGAALEVLQHTLSTGETRLIQRLVAPLPKLYQMGEFARFADGSIAVY